MDNGGIDLPLDMRDSIALRPSISTFPCGFSGGVHRPPAPTPTGCPAVGALEGGGPALSELSCCSSYIRRIAGRLPAKPMPTVGVEKNTFRTKVPRAKLGFFGCHVIDGVVRVTTDTPRRSYPKKLDLVCPGCGELHERTEIMWRVPTPYDEGREAAVIQCG